MYIFGILGKTLFYFEKYITTYYFFRTLLKTVEFFCIRGRIDPYLRFDLNRNDADFFMQEILLLIFSEIARKFLVRAVLLTKNKKKREKKSFDAIYIRKNCTKFFLNLNLLIN